MPIRPDLEEEANVFACFLLMPSVFFIEDMKNNRDAYDDDNVKKLSKKYDVPVAAVIKRIGLWNTLKK